jgi:hypothetical protein
MRQAFFIAGFNNWGKTTIIQELFDNTRFYQDKTYKISGVNADFTVETHSNDDFIGQKWVENIQKRIKKSPDNGNNLFTALCPSLEKRNNFLTLLKQPTLASYGKLHIFLIEYKWEHHAKLMIDNIIVSASEQLPNANFIRINTGQHLTKNEDRLKDKLLQIRKELNTIFK